MFSSEGGNTKQMCYEGKNIAITTDFPCGSIYFPVVPTRPISEIDQKSVETGTPCQFWTKIKVAGVYAGLHV